MANREMRSLFSLPGETAKVKGKGRRDQDERDRHQLRTDAMGGGGISPGTRICVLRADETEMARSFLLRAGQDFTMAGHTSTIPEQQLVLEGAIQAYCIAGDLLPKSRLLALADQLISELKAYKKESLKRLS